MNTGEKTRIGCCGFPISRDKYFAAFDIVEIQQTFYDPPRLPTALKWSEAAPPGFEYTLKTWQLITHDPRSPTYRRLKTRIPESKKKYYGFFKPTDEVFEPWERTKEIADALHAGIIVFQCPASFQPSTENIGNMKQFFTRIKRGERVLAWEPRGEWDASEIKALCRGLNLTHIVDPFKSKSLHGEAKYYRLHGIEGYRYRYTEEDLMKLVRLTDKEKKNCFMFNNVYMFENALELKNLF